MKRLRTSPLLIVMVMAAAWYSPAARGANQVCDGEEHDCGCSAATICWCCDESGNFGETCGNCVWWAWHEACCHWNDALAWCTDAKTWDDYARDNGYPLGNDPENMSIFVRESGTWGHVGWVTAAHPDGSCETTEMYCGGPCGVHSQTREAGYADAFIYSKTGPVEVDDARLVSETIPAGTHFNPGETFTKTWTLENTGTTTWTRDGGYVLAWVSDEQFSAAEQTQLASGVSVAPDDRYEWEVPMTAPSTPGTYMGYWRMEHTGVERFGDRVSVEIIVDEVVVEPEAQPETAEEDTPEEDGSDASADVTVMDSEPSGDAPSEALAGHVGVVGGCSCTVFQ
jgi:hypothetical protein